MEPNSLIVGYVDPVGIRVWRFPKIRGTFLGVPIIRIIIFWGLDWGPPILGNYHLRNSYKVHPRPFGSLSYSLRQPGPIEQQFRRVYKILIQHDYTVLMVNVGAGPVQGFQGCTLGPKPCTPRTVQDLG